jgi:carbamoyl-phosphate synthase small subunit
VDKRNSQVYVTSQNHGYGIDPKSLGKTGFKVWFSNADDDTVEGIEHKGKPIIAVQFHPEASPGPYDCMFVFDRFKEVIANGITQQQPPVIEEQVLKKKRSPRAKAARKKVGGGRKVAKR